MEHLGPIPGSLCMDAYHISTADWLDMDPAEKSLFRMAYAADFWHIQEDAAHTNHGLEVTRVLALCDVDAGNPWCAAIRSAYLMDSGVPRANLPVLCASVHGWGEWATRVQRLRKTPSRSDAGLIYHTATTGHLVTVSHVQGDSVYTIEGNTNQDGSRDGYGVFRRVRNVGEFYGFVDCHRLK